MPFSRSEYEGVIGPLKSQVKFPSEIVTGDWSSWTLVRHDIEFSVSRAEQMAQWDESLGIRSLFMVQVRSHAYNPFSQSSAQRLERIRNLGHQVGLHLYLPKAPICSLGKIEKEIADQAALLERATGQPVEVVSAHRPAPWFLRHRKDYLAERINLYGPSFFEYSEAPTEIKYCADSRHTFDYAQPRDLDLRGKNHLLMHPDEWSELGHDKVANFQSLFACAQEELVATFQAEASHFDSSYLET